MKDLSAGCGPRIGEFGAMVVFCSGKGKASGPADTTLRRITGSAQGAARVLPDALAGMNIEAYIQDRADRSAQRIFGAG